VNRIVLTISLLFISGCIRPPVNTDVPAHAPTPRNDPVERHAEFLSGLVVHVLDGDSIVFREEIGEKVTTIRLAGIDAPERTQPFFKVSRRNLQELVLGQQVVVSPLKTDQYGRTVAGVRRGETDVSLEMLRRGLAWHFKRYENEQPEAEGRLYAEAEAAARRENAGLWADANATPPWEYRDQRRANQEPFR
jgi:endonuclease YncB( thermonuclease family)